MLERAFVRFRESIPDNPNTYAAADGFRQMGVEVVPFYGFGDLQQHQGSIGPTGIVCGNIGDVWEALKLVGLPKPRLFDYPEHLTPFMGRSLERATLAWVRGSTKRFFVKPALHQKLFTGFVWEPDDFRCQINVAPYPDDTECWVSDVVDMVSEWRCYIKRDTLIGVKHYKGDWSKPPKPYTVDLAVSLGRGKMPDAYALDFGVTADGSTVLVEANDGFALGNYGLASVVYARFMEARWQQFFEATPV